jgi:hypothetical protein
MKKPKTIAKLKKELEILVNQFIRLRDKGKPCISCGEIKPLQAGHFYPKSVCEGLRFDEVNINGECSECNCFDDRHILTYSENLINRIGIDEFEALKQRAAEYKRQGYKFTRSELIEKIAEYKTKIANLESF